eukprot:TRINITY_DN3138_c0_g1_i1.p2 TRINITY_DN3138_c0_g1~~TRINITY_DN3138_c0_g1_i1.p2  ORF type:complete len:233 (-),score=67.50 TRINITY_DN3138_c0_g1_i1:85-783(-)
MSLMFERMQSDQASRKRSLVRENEADAEADEEERDEQSRCARRTADPEQLYTAKYVARRIIEHLRDCSHTTGLPRHLNELVTATAHLFRVEDEVCVERAFNYLLELGVVTVVGAFVVLADRDCRRDACHTHRVNLTNATPLAWTADDGQREPTNRELFLQVLTAAVDRIEKLDQPQIAIADFHAALVDLCRRVQCADVTLVLNELTARGVLTTNADTSINLNVPDIAPPFVP